jgi:hypothetical protein
MKKEKFPGVSSGTASLKNTTGATQNTKYLFKPIAANISKQEGICCIKNFVTYIEPQPRELYRFSVTQ